MKDEPGKKRKRQTPMQSFTNVPKMLAEARQLVDAVTEPGPALATEDSKQTNSAGEALALSSPPVDTRQPKPAEASLATRKKKSTRSSPQKPEQILPTGPSPGGAPVGEGAIYPLGKTLPPTTARSPESVGIRLLHRVHGRTRLKIPRLKWNDRFANLLAERLAVIPGVLGLETSTVTGSATFYYNARDLCQPEGLKALREAWQELFPSVEPERLTSLLMGLPGV